MSFVDEPFVHDIDFSRLKREYVTFVSEEFEGRESDIIWRLPARADPQGRIGCLLC
jgi:hypothetical protein